jgi:hypothetical protein
MIQSTYDNNKLSPDEEKADKIFNKLISDNPTPVTPGQIVDICHEIKNLPVGVSGNLWQRLRNSMSLEDFDRLHTFYVNWTLGQRWSL